MRKIYKKLFELIFLVFLAVIFIFYMTNYAPGDIYDSVKKIAPGKTYQNKQTTGEHKKPTD